MKAGQFQYDGISRRMIMGAHDEREYEFHCGDCFEIQIEGKWYPVRIEHSMSVNGGWYLIGLPPHFQNSALGYQGNQARIK
jgi:hypothetical protein